MKLTLVSCSFARCDRRGATGPITRRILLVDWSRVTEERVPVDRACSMRVFRVVWLVGRCRGRVSSFRRKAIEFRNVAAGNSEWEHIFVKVASCSLSWFSFMQARSYCADCDEYGEDDGQG